MEQKGIQTIYDIFTQPLHFLVTEASQPVPGDLAIGADDFHIGVVATLGAREDARVEVLQVRVPDTMKGEHRGDFGGSVVQIRCRHWSSSCSLAFVLGRSSMLWDADAIR